MRLIIKVGNNFEISEIGSIINRETALKPMGFGQLSVGEMALRSVGFGQLSMGKRH